MHSVTRGQIRQQGPIYETSYDNLTITTYDGRLIYQTSYEERKLFLGRIFLQNRKVVGDISLRYC